MSLPECIERQMFLDTQLQPMEGICVSLNCSILYFKKRYAQKMSGKGTDAVAKDIYFGHRKRITIHSRHYIAYKYPVVTSRSQ